MEELERHCMGSIVCACRLQPSMEQRVVRLLRSNVRESGAPLPAGVAGVQGAGCGDRE